MTEYEKAYATYNQLATRAKSGDRVAMADKAKAMNEVRAIERDAARSGTILTPIGSARGITVETASAASKRSLQDEYVRKFDANKAVCEIAGKQQTRADYHRARLLGK